MINTRRAKTLAEEHWKYVGALLKTHGASDEELMRVGFHFKTAFVHGFKHGIEEVENE